MLVSGVICGCSMLILLFIRLFVMVMIFGCSVLSCLIMLVIYVCLMVGLICRLVICVMVKLCNVVGRFVMGIVIWVMWGMWCVLI